MNEELKQRAFEMYQAPFKYEWRSWAGSGAITDSLGRRFGTYRIDDNGELIAAALNEYWEKHK